MASGHFSLAPSPNKRKVLKIDLWTLTVMEMDPSKRHATSYVAT